MPQTRLRMNSLSSQPFSKMCQRMPQISATSVPGRKRTYSVACAAVRVKRGSSTISGRVVLLLGLQQMLQRDRMRLGRIAADQEDRLRLHDVVVGVRHRAVAPGVGDTGDGRRVADARLMVDVVRAPEGGELADQVGLLVAVLGRAQPVDAIGTRRLADLQHLVADLVDRLIPGDPRPLAADELHRVLEAALAVGVLAHRRTLGAVGAEVERAVEAGLLADPDAVLDFGDDGAADRAVSADRLLDLDLAASRRPCGLSLAHAARQRRRRGETADGEARIAQEGAAIERAGCSSRGHARLAQALSGTDRFLSQHCGSPGLGDRLRTVIADSGGTVRAKTVMALSARGRSSAARAPSRGTASPCRASPRTA